MSANQYLPFANGTGANALSQGQYAALGTLLSGGFQSGVALSIQANALFRQLSVAISAISQFVADNQTQDVLDDGVVGNYETKFEAALLAFVQREGIAFAADGGTTDVLSATPNPALTAYKAGQVIAVQKNASVATNQTATPTINLNGLGAVTITKASGMPLYTGDLPQGGVFFAIFDGTFFRHVGLTLSTADLRVQAGQAVVFIASGTNAYTGTLVPAPTALTPRMEVLGVFTTANTSAASPTLLLNGIGTALPIIKQGGGTPTAGDLSGFVPLILNTAGMAWIINGLVTSDILAIISSVTRINLTGNLVVYVRTDGNDANGGLTNSPTGAFATIQGAINKIFGVYNLAGYSFAIQLALAPGQTSATFPGAVVPNVGVSGAISIQGNNSNQSAFVITPVVQTDGSYNCFNANVSTVSVTGVTLDVSSVTGQGAAIYCGTGSTVGYGYVTLRTTGSSTGLSLVAIKAAATALRIGPITVTGGGTVGAVIYVSQGGTDGGCISSTPQAFAVNGITFSNFYFIADGTASLAQTTFTGTGNTGSRYAVSLNGSIDPQGQALSVIPGNTNGVTATGGQVPGDLGTAWTPYTPTISASSGTLTSATAAGRYQRNGKTITVQVTGVIATNGTGAGVITMGLPFTAAGADYAFAGKDTGLTNKALSAHVNAGAAFNIEFYDGSYPGANGARLSLTGIYETSQ